jgi:hypothetical protein
VDYHPQAYAAYIRNADGSGEPAPAEVSLSLTFKETEIISKQFLNPGMRPSVLREPDIPIRDTQQPSIAETFQTTGERLAITPRNMGRPIGANAVDRAQPPR